MLPVLLLLIFVISLGFYLLTLHYEYWKKRGVPGPKPMLLLGNIKESFMMKTSPFELYADFYRQYKKYPFVGIFKATSPTLLICDPELIKDMTVKNFHHFHDNDIHVDKNIDPIFGRNPFCLRGEEWKTVRKQLTPGFTSGKMKWVYPLLENVSQQMVDFIENEANALNGEGYEAKELCSKFTLNNVANCAFGVDAKAFTKEKSEFQEIGKQIFEIGTISNIIFMVAFLFPSLMKLIRLKFIKKEIEVKLIKMVTETLKYRQENNIVRNDFLHILSQLKDTCQEYEFTDIDVAAHAAGFFLDGYETSATVMSFVLYELAANPQVQKKLREELTESLHNNGGKLPYDVLQGLPYLDAVLNETLRKHPPLFALGKICTKSYTYVPKKGDGLTQTVEIEKGTPIIIPLSGFHYDPEYFENPAVFNPERFIDGNIPKYTFMPFGEGPRACLGQRFGVLQIKIGIAYVINNFTLGVNAKTKLPLQYDPASFITAPKGGLWIDFEKIA